MASHGLRPRIGHRGGIGLCLVLAMVAVTVAQGARGGLPSAGATSPQIGDIVSVNLNQVASSDLASLGLDGLTKARGQNGNVAVVGNTAFVGGGALFHGAQASGGRICTDFGGVKVVDITNPASPVLRTPIPITDTKGALQGPTTSPRYGKKFDNVSASAGGVDAMSITAAMGVNIGGTPFAGDILAVAIQRCEQSFFAGGRIEFWNVTDPTNPALVGTFDPAAQPWGIYEEVRMFTRVVGGVAKLYALATTPFSIGNAHGAITTGDMRMIDITNLANPTQNGTFPNVQIGQSSTNGCKSFLAGRSAAPTPDHNGAILSFYDGSTNVANLAPNTTAEVFKLDLNNLPSAPNDTTPVAFSPQPTHYDTPTTATIEGNAADVAPFITTTPDATNGHLLTAMSEDIIDPSTTHFNIDAPASATYASGPGAACEEYIGKKMYSLLGQAVAASIVDVGRGCPASSLNGTLQRAADPYLADPNGKIAMVDSGGSGFDGCSAVEKASRAAAAGAVALLTNGGGPPPLNSTNNGPPGAMSSIPSISIETNAVNKIQFVPNPNLSGTTYPTSWDRNLIGGSVVSGGAPAGATSIPVTATTIAIVNNAVVSFTNGVNATLTASAAVGATSLAVTALSGAVAGSTVGNVNVSTTGASQPGDTSVAVLATSVPISARTNLIFGGTVATLSADAAAGSTSLSVNPLPAPITAPNKTSLVSNATVQPLCVVNNVSVNAAAAAGVSTLSVRPTTVSLPAGSVLPFPGNVQVTLSAPAPAGSTSLSVNSTVGAIALNAAAIAACPDGTRVDLYRTDVARYRSLANPGDTTGGKGQINATNLMAVTAGQAYDAAATLEVEDYVAGTFQAEVVWIDSSGAVLSTTTVASQSAAAASRTPSPQVVVTAPAGAVKAAMRFEWTGAGAGGLAYADGFSFVPDALHGGASDSAGLGGTSPQWGAQRIIDFSTSPPSLLSTYRSPNSMTWPPPDDGLYTPRRTKMLGSDVAFTTWMSDGLRVLDLRHPTSPRLVGSFVPPGVNDPAAASGAGGGLSRGQVWPNRTLVTGVDLKPTGPDTGYVVVSDINAGLYVLSYSVVRVKPVVADFDASGSSDLSVFRPSTGTWYASPSTAVNFGTSGDLPVPGNYAGTTTTDMAVFRPSNGTWYVNGGTTVNFGTNGDLPVPADYNGDGKTDIAVFRPSTGTWYVNGGTTMNFGTNGDIPVPGDYNGTHSSQMAVFRPSTGTWYINGGATVNFGTSGDIPVPGDYNGDGITDIAVFRPSTGIWYIQPSGGGAFTATNWGASGDIPVPGDFNGDGKTDVAVFRPSTGTWYVQLSGGGITVTNFGVSGDIPLELPSAIRQAFFP